VYDTRLSIEQVLAALAEQPKTIERLTAGLPASMLDRAARDSWSLNEVLAHLRACSDMWGGYIQRIAAEDHPTIRAVNPRTWIKSTNYPSLPFGPSLRAYMRQRSDLVRLLESLPEAAWSRTALVTGAGKPRARSVLEYALWLANHERSHLKQIGNLAAHR
jgi:hypothetical protein